MADKTAMIGKIVEVMLDTWDLPADCNEGELFTYAETLYDRIAAGDGKDNFTPIFPRCRSTSWKWRSRTRSRRLSIVQSSSVDVKAECFPWIRRT
jgi:hypothetical protein